MRTLVDTHALYWFIEGDDRLSEKAIDTIGERSLVMPLPISSQPTEVELMILRILWDQGPSTARQIHIRLAEKRDTNYSTTVKMLSVMLEKRLVKRDEAVRPQVYRPAASQERTQQRMLKDLIQRVYDGSAGSLVLQALSSQKASPAELAEIRRLLGDLEKEQP